MFGKITKTNIYIYIYMKFLRFFLFFFLLKFSSSDGQSLYPIDTAFLHYLKDSIPNVIKSDSLIIDSAHVCTHDILVQGSFHYEIKNADGLQFFDRIHQIAFEYTQIITLPHLVSDSLYGLGIDWSPIHSLPALDSLPNLEGLSFEYDSLTSLPDLSHLKKLEYIDIVGNMLDSIPSLDSMAYLYQLRVIQTYKPIHKLPNLLNNKNLEDLYVYESGIDSLPALDSCRNLFSIYAFNNNLQSLPNLNNNHRLTIIDCLYNSLTKLPSLSGCPLLEVLLAYHNELDSIPDLSNNTQLTTLYLDSNRLTNIPDISGLPLLTLFHASANKLTSVPKFSTQNVKDLDLSHNFLTEFPVPYLSEPINWLLKDNLIATLPDYSFQDSFAVVDISENKLDFSDAYSMKLIDERTSFNAPYSNLQYANLCCSGYGYYSSIDYVYTLQKPFGNIDTVLTDTYADTVLSISSQQYADSYQWYHGDSAIGGATDTLLHIYCATSEDAGKYTCHSIGQYFNAHDFRFNYGITEFVSEPQTLIVNPNSINTNLAAIYPTVISSGNATLKYSLPEAQSVILDIYDLKGSLAFEYYSGLHPHGEYTIPLNLSELASGSYIAQTRYSLGYKKTMRLIILK